MSLQLARFDPTPCGFPKPRVPLLPVKPIFGRNQSAHKEFANRFRHFTRGRYALSEAYRLAGVGLDGSLLAPAYHCVSMLDPALNLGAEIQLYPLHADLSPNLSALNDLLKKAVTPVKALLATHFFGFAQDFGRMKQWCDKHRIALIEDCSHALFTEAFQAAGTGTFGQFVSSSPYKFFACKDGGILYSPEEKLLERVKTSSAGLMSELSGIKHGIEKRCSHNSMKHEIPFIDQQLQTLIKSPVICANEKITSCTKPSSLFSSAEARTRSLRSSRFVVNHASIEENIKRRRHNYEYWIKAVVGLPNAHPLYPNLPKDCVPYMFPLYIDRPGSHFYWLKHLGVPIWRWDEMAVSDCPIAQDYRLHMIHLPCHQSLTEDQMDWMIAAVQKTLTCPSQGDL